MRSNFVKTTLKTAVLAVTVLLLGASVALAQPAVNLFAGPSAATLPDGTMVPMWGYRCGGAIPGSTATCNALNPTAGAGWSPVVITVPTGSGLTINLGNNLSFAAGAGTNRVPTSIVIVGQLGGGLGNSATTVASPSHATQSATWPIANAGPTNVPPPQGPRVQSFAHEVPGGGKAVLTWASLRPGTYLIESGTHPSIQGPMGLYGILVVTSAAGVGTPGTAYPGVSYNAEVSALFSEIDPVQNNAVSAAVSTVGFSELAVWSGLPDGCGNPASTTYKTCYPPAVNYTPLYYMVNGVAFNKSGASASLFPASPATGVTGTVLVRMVNAGLRMHVPSIVGSQTATPAVGGLSLIAEDGNVLPGLPKVQSEVFMAAGKTYDVMVNVPAAGAPALPVYDRELSLSGNSINRDAGMLAYIGINGAGLPAAPALGAAAARADTYPSLIAGKTLTVSDPSKGVIVNDTNVYGVHLLAPAAHGAVTLNANGTFTYVPSGTATSDSFTYCANGTVTGTTCSSGITATVTLGAATIEAGTGIVMNPITYSSNVASSLSIKTPGILSVDKDTAGFPLTVAASSVAAGSGITSLSVDSQGGFNASVGGPGTYTFTYKAQNSQGTVSATTATVTLIFAAPSGLAVTVVDGSDKKTPIADYRWIIEEDRTFYIDPKCATNPPPAGCPYAPGGIVPTFGTNFHTSYMPVVATGCTGPLSCEAGQTVLGQAAVCDGGNGVCRTTATQETAVDPSQVTLDPTKRYYISVLPGDAANPFNTGNAQTGHGMGGAPIAAGQTAVTILAQPTPFPPSRLSVFVFEDDFPLNGENDSGGQVIDTSIAGSTEPGLSGFNITLFDDAGGTGDATGQMTYDMFNQPMSNALDGTIDPATGQNACPITKQATGGITGTIVTCPDFEADGVTTSPLRGQVVVANMMPGRYGVVATPAADRIAKGEEWLQTNTLDGQKAHDSFLRIGEPAYFQEFGPAGYHVSIGFANPKIINDRLKGVCNGTDPNLQASPCNNSLRGTVTTTRMSRTPDERLYSSGSYDSFSFTNCYVSVGDPDGEDFAFQKCAGDGTFNFTGLPSGNWRITVFDQWNDMLVDGLSTPVGLGGSQLCPGAGSSASACNIGDLATNQWQANIYTNTFFDQNGNGVRDSSENGLTLVPTNVRFRDGSFSNFNNTDLNGNAGFNEEFPLFSWYVVEADTTRYKNTGTHVVYDAGGPADGSAFCGNGTNYPTCDMSAVISANMANSRETVPLPANLRVPGAVYCDNADCNGFSIASGPGSSASANLSTGRIDPPWVVTEGWQGYSGQNSFLEFGKKPYAVGENGGIKGHVIYASTRPFDDPQLLLQTSWEPLVPNVTVNLYQEGTAPDGSQTLTLVDTTKTSSFDDWAQGFRSDGIPNMNCANQSTSDLFYFSLYNQPNWLDEYNNGGVPAHTLPNNSQFKCYDGMHNWNQLQPAPYDGLYHFPSVTGINPTTGNTTGTNCTICVKNPDATDPFRFGKEDMLPSGKYVVEVVVPPGYELVKEEDKNILIGDNYIAPAIQQFGGLGNVFILPDQAEIGASTNGGNPQNSTQNLGRVESLPSHEGDTGEVETFWPCVGQARVVPDFISLFPQSNEVAPFAGATRNLCDRKEVALDDQSQALAKFYVFTSTHAAAHFTGVITDDFTSEFDPFSPQFGEKFAPPDMPISIKDWAGNEISRIYTDHWGAYNGLTYSTWEVNPPNPTGYAPTMMVTCMNDKTRADGSTDPLYNPSYSQFCYEIPFMPGQTQYMDTPVVPTSAFVGAGYNNPDCSYPAATPAVAEVDGDGIGPWILARGTAHPVTITALGDTTVTNYGYSGPSAAAPPFNQKTITRHYGFGTQCTSPTAGSSTCNTLSSVTVGGVAATISGWSDTSITVSLPTTAAVPACAVQQQAQYGGSSALCGQIVITAGNGLQSIDTVNLTIGGKAPTHVTSNDPMTAYGPGAIQKAIDAAMPGDLIILDPTCTSAGLPVACTTAGATHSASTHNEMLLMWKPVRLQGVGAVSSVIDANSQPAGKLDPWRRQVACLFGIAINGVPITGSNQYDPSGTYTCPAPMRFSVDRLPLEAVVGWDATLNGNLAELLQEPTLMGAYEGAGITVLGKGVDFHTTDPAVIWAADTFPTGTTLLTSANCGKGTPGSAGYVANPFPGNYQCNPSSIDGLTITDSSQGGGGIFVHAWGHNLQIANDRVHSNIGTLTGGVNVGQGEFPPQTVVGSIANAAPGSCQTSSIANQQLPYCFDLNVNVHNNAITANMSIGDELFTATPAGAGGISFCNGADYYKFNYNWLCGNMSTGDGGGLGHIGYMWNGDIEHNTILFNQSLNPTIPTNGGGILVMGSPDTDPVCGTAADADCPPGLSDGVGPGLVINANLIMGNAAESGSGGGLRLQGLNGTEVTNFPTNPSRWYHVTVTNNIIANNVAGWDGAGVSLQDALYADLINNTIMDNDTTASSGVLFDTIGAPLASAGGTNCNNGVQSCPQPAGLVSVPHSSPLIAAITGVNITCPANHYSGTTATNGSCRRVSYPYLTNDVFWQNRAFYIGVGALSAQYQQNVVSLFNAFSHTAAASQPSADATAGNGNGVIITGGTGACTPGASYWEIGVRGDTGPSNHGSGFTLAPTYSVLTDAAADYSAAALHNSGSNPTVVSQYCNGSRIPPEFASGGFQVPPGISDATVPNPIFNLTPSATVDEGNNWINISWGPLAMTNPVSNMLLGNYAQAAGSPATDYIPTTSAGGLAAPKTDFFGRTRPQGSAYDVGAVEFPQAAAPIVSVTGGPLAFGSQAVNTTSASRTLTLHNTGNAAFTGITLSFTTGFARATAGGTCGATLAAASTCTINVVFQPTAVQAYSGTLTITGNVAVTGSPVSLTGNGVTAVVAATLTPTSHNYGTATRGVGVLGAPTQVFTLTNTGNVPLTGVTAGVLGGTNPTEFSIVALLSTCGNATHTTLAPGATCAVTVQFRPLTTQTTGAKSGTLSVGDLAGTQTSTLTGTAN